MSVNLLDMLSDQVTGQLANQASSFLGENESSVTNALGGIFPSLLGSMIGQAKDESSASGLMDMIGGVDTSMLGDIGGLFGGGASSVNGLLNSGGGILNSLLGNNMGGIVDIISKVSGLGSGSSSSLMKMAAPFLMSMIGKQVAGKGASGLMSLLSSQKDIVANALPSGMGSILGLDLGAMVNSAKGAVTGAASAATGAAKSVAGTATNVAGNVANTAGAAASTGAGWIKWALPFLAIAAIGIWFFTKGGADKVTNVVGDAVELTKAGADAVGDAATTAVDMSSNAVDAVKDVASTAWNQVDKGAKEAMDKISFKTGSAGEQMKNYISGGFKGDSRFTFKNLNFASGSAELQGGNEIDNLASILKAYPAVKVSINGYTDNTGDAGANMKLSDARAAAVMGRLIAQGVDAGRITYEGYGDANPVADNSTAEGRAMNRRIEISIEQ